MRLVFAGTPAAAVPSLTALAATRHELVTVLSRQDAPLGRTRVLTPSPVAAAAGELGLHVVKANRLDEAVTAELTALNPDLGVIVAYGALVREPLLSAPRLGWINLHFSLLPAWRGAAPVQRAIMSGDTVTGASVFRLVAELDAGDSYGSVTRPIGPDETAADVLGDLAVHGAVLLTRVVDELDSGAAVATAQSGAVTLAPKLGSEDAHVDWRADASAVYDRIRGVTPEPGAFTTVGDTRVKILRSARIADAALLPPGVLAEAGGRVLVGTATEPIELVELQPAGKRAMGAVDWWRGLADRTQVAR